LVNDLGLSPDSMDAATIRAELMRELANIHPDKSGGTFPNPQVEARFHRLRDAIEYMKERPPVPLELGALEAKLDAKFDAMIEGLNALRTVRSLEVSTLRRNEGDEELPRRSRQIYMPARIRSGVFASICGTILALLTIFRENPFLAPLAHSPVVLGSLLSFLIISSGAFSVLWLREYRAEKRTEWLSSDSGIATIMQAALGIVKPQIGDNSVALVTKRDLVDAILNHNRPWERNLLFRSLKRLLHPTIPTRVAEEIASRHLQELVRRGSISPYDVQTFEPTYSVSKSVIEDLWKYRSHVDPHQTW